MRIYCNTNQFPVLTFCGPHSKTHGTRRLSKHYYLRFDQKVGNGVWAICCMPCACVACTSIQDKPWTSGIPSDEQEIYKPVTECTQWPVFRSFKNWYIILLSHNPTPSNAFGEIPCCS